MRKEVINFMKIVYIIDMQNDFINGSLGTPEAEIAVQNAIKWLKENLSDEDMVFLTRDTHDSDYLDTPEGKQLPIKHCIKGTYGWKFWEELYDVVRGNIQDIFNKPTFGCRDFVDCVIDEIEYEDEAVEIIFMGLCTDICVISNVLMMKEALGNIYDIPIKVLSDCCAGVTPAKHDAALEVMRSCQIDVI